MIFDNFEKPSSQDMYKLISNYSTIESEQHLKESLSKILHIPKELINQIEDIRSVYNNYLLKYYPNETVIKSCFINKVLTRGKTHITIFELPVGESRVDLCKVNGSSIAYEIKTDLDNFNRLDKQILDYSYIFDKVYIICSKNNIKKIIHIIPDFCGIYTYKTTNYGVSFNLYRHAKEAKNIISKKQLELLKKKDLEVLSNPSCTLTKQEHINTILQTYSNEKINTLFKCLMKKYYQNNWDFFKDNFDDLLEIDYQWFFKNRMTPSFIYQGKVE